MRKKPLAILFLIFFLFLTRQCFASGFNFKSIGTVNTDGKLYPQWWYTGTQPTLAGEAPADSVIDITIDTDSYQTTADSSSNWSFTPPTTLAIGDHSVSLANNGSTISFTLTLGSEDIDWDTISTGGEPLPTVGFVWPTILLALSGLPLIFLSDFIKNS